MEATLFPVPGSVAPEEDLACHALADLRSAVRAVSSPAGLVTGLCQAISDAFGVNDVSIHALDARGRLQVVGRAGDPAPVPPCPDAIRRGRADRCDPAAEGDDTGIGALLAGRFSYLWWPAEPETRPPWARVVFPLSADGGHGGILSLAVRGEESEFAEALQQALMPFMSPAAAALMCAQQKIASQRGAERLAALQHLSGALASHSSLDDLLRDACDTLLRVTEMDLAAVALVESGTGRFEPRVVRGSLPDCERFHTAFSPDDCLTGRVGRDRRVQFHRHLQRDESPEAQAAREVGLETAVSVPLWLREELLGMLTLGSLQSWELSPEELELIEAVGHQLSAAVANAALLKHAQRQMEEQRGRSEELQVLYHISHAMVATNSLEERLREIARGLTRVTGTSHCAIFRTEPDGLAPWVCHGPSEEQSKQFHLLPLPPEEMKRLLRRLSRRGAFVASDAARSPFARSEWLREQRIRAGLCLPFQLEQQVTAVALCYRPGEEPTFSPEQMRRGEAVAALGSIAVRMSQAFEHQRNIAVTLQRGLQPTVVRSLGYFELGSTYRPALQEARVGGDFYDVFLLPGDRVALLMADVSGKGLSAAVQTAMIKNMLRLIAFENADPAVALTRLNQALHYFTESELFVTAFYGLLDPRTGELQYANAGHDNPLLYRAREQFCTSLDTTGMALGMDAESHYSGRRLGLERGDVLLLYTDGITEARRGASFLGRERLEDMLVRFVDARPSRIVQYVYREAKAFSDSALHDDVALLCLKARG